MSGANWTSLSSSQAQLRNWATNASMSSTYKLGNSTRTNLCETNFQANPQRLYIPAKGLFNRLAGYCLSLAVKKRFCRQCDQMSGRALTLFRRAWLEKALFAPGARVRPYLRGGFVIFFPRAEHRLSFNSRHPGTNYHRLGASRASSMLFTTAHIASRLISRSIIDRCSQESRPSGALISIRQALLDSAIRTKSGMLA
jgi:hypothetical protein